MSTRIAAIREREPNCPRASAEMGHCVNLRRVLTPSLTSLLETLRDNESLVAEWWERLWFFQSSGEFSPGKGVMKRVECLVGDPRPSKCPWQS